MSHYCLKSFGSKGTFTSSHTEFDPRIPHSGGRERTPSSCSPASARALCTSELTEEQVNVEKERAVLWVDFLELFFGIGVKQVRQNLILNLGSFCLDLSSIWGYRCVTNKWLCGLFPRDLHSITIIQSRFFPPKFLVVCFETLDKRFLFLLSPFPRLCTSDLPLLCETVIFSSC